MERSSCAGARTRIRRTAVWISCAASLAALPAAATAEAATTLTQVGTFASPVYAVSPPADASRLFVVERRGTVQMIRGGVVSQFLDLQGDVRSPGAPDAGGTEEGLLSIAFAPDYATSRKLYVYFTNNAGDIQVDELTATDDFDSAGAPRRNVITIPHPINDNHNGGQLQFGPDGFLYLGPGDGGAGNDPPNNAQNLNVLLGKLLRIDPRAATPYGIPAGNPFAGQSGARPEIWSYGLRNPWRFSFDRGTAALTIGDVGQGAWEEIDYVPGSAAGLNFGWRVFEGRHQTINGGTAPGHVPPVLEYSQSATGGCAVTGGYVVRDPALPELVGRYLYADFCVGALRSAVLAVPDAQDDRSVGLGASSISSFGEDALCRVYVVSLEGPVYRLTDPASTATSSCPSSPPGGGAGPPPPGGDTGTPGTTPDTRAPTLRLGSRRRQSILRRRTLTLGASCDERCRLTVRAATSRPAYRLRGARRTLEPGTVARVRLRIGPRAVRVLRRRLRNGARVTALVRATATDAAGNRRRAARRIRLTAR